MRRIKLISSFFFCLATSFSYSQGEFLIEIDTSTGSYNHIGNAISGIHWVSPYIRGYDETHGAYIFQGGMSNVDHLYSIDVTNGNIISNPYFYPAPARELKHDNTNDSLYGLYWDNSQSTFFMASVDPITGACIHITTNTISGLGGTSQGATAYDDTHHYYFALQNNQIFTIDATNGTLISSPTLILISGEQLFHFSYSRPANTLYGLLENSNTNITYLVSINTTTGVVTKIGSGNSFTSGGGSSSIDEINQRYIYFHSTGSSNYYITTLDIPTGSVVANKPVPLSSGSNLHSISFDNIKGKLYGIQWEATVTDINTFTSSNTVKIYPIPTSNNIIVESPTTLGTITICNTLGQILLQIKSRNNQEQIDISKLPTGIYTIQVQDKYNKIIKD